MSKFNKLETYDTFHWKNLRGSTLVGIYDMPQLQPVTDVAPRNLLPFHECMSEKHPEDKWFHFYIDDYQFERIWKSPGKYLPILARFEGGITTDFSLYLDMPRGQQVWNCWRNRHMAYVMQQYGLTVIPNVCWSDQDSLSWAFDGLPEKSVLSITTQGCMRERVCKQSLLNGLHELVRQKHPVKLIVYGRFPETWLDKFPMPIEVYASFAQQKWGA